MALNKDAAVISAKLL